MVRGGGKRCWEIHPLTSNAHFVIQSDRFPPLFLWFCEWMKLRGIEKDRETEKERVRSICGCAWKVAAARCPSLCAQNLLHNLPAYFKALMQYCFCCFLLPLSPIFCLIVIHVQSVCLANLLAFRLSQQSYFMSMCHWVYFMLSFVLSASPWWFTPLSEMLQDVFTSSRLFLPLEV